MEEEGLEMVVFWLKMLAYATGIVSNGVFVYLMWMSTIEGYTVILNKFTAPYGEQWVEIPLAIFGIIALFLMMMFEIKEVI